MSDIRAAAERLRQYVCGLEYNQRQHAEDLALITAALDIAADDDDQPVTDEWLKSIGFSNESINGVSLLVPSHDGNGDPVELYIGQKNFAGEPFAGYLASLLQSNSEDHVLLTGKVFWTRGDVRRLCKALGI